MTTTKGIFTGSYSTMGNNSNKLDKDYSVRVNNDKLTKAKMLGLNPAEIFRHALDEAVGSNRCPMCKRPFGPNEKKKRGKKK